MKTVCIVALAFLLTPAPARADGLFVPFVGADFGGDAGSCRGVTPCTSRQVTYGASLGFMIGGIFGLEGEFAYAPRFFGEGSARPDNYLLTGMVNLMAGVPLGPVRPYVVGGIGLLRADVSRSEIGLFQAYANNSIAFDAGGGLLGMFSNHVGVRGDLRYVRTLDDIALTQFELNDKQLQFWRSSIGVVFRF